MNISIHHYPEFYESLYRIKVMDSAAMRQQRQSRTLRKKAELTVEYDHEFEM